MFGLRGHRLRADNAELRAEVERLRIERDAARREAGALAARADGTDPATEPEQFLFVVTYGKSGSTLLMGLLDSLPGFCIRGENRGALYHLFQYHSKAETERAKWAKKEPLRPTHPWYGIDDYPSATAVARLRRLVVDTLLRPEPGTRVAGFKEVRWWMPKPVEYLDFIDTLFPGARYILNTRNLDDVAQSSWWRKKPNARADLGNVEERLKDTIARRGERGYHVHYDDYVNDPSVLRGLCDWLGVEYDAERFAAVFDVRHTTGAGSGQRVERAPGRAGGAV